MRFVIVSSLDALARLAAAKYLARRWPSAEFIRWDITADGFTWMAHNNTSGASAYSQLMWLAIAL